jgi:hypothetical protein
VKTCRHCATGNQDDAALCIECGLELSPSPSIRAAAAATALCRRIVIWKATSVILIIVALVYWVLALVSVRMALHFSHLGNTAMASFLRWGVFWNTIVAVLCFVGRLLMRRDTRISVLAGNVAVLGALLITVRNWLDASLRGRNPYPAIEILLIWLPLIYVLLYGWCQNKLQKPNQAA